MPPKVKVTKQDIINASVEIVRKMGAENLNARTIALLIGCSTQPIFSNFSSMDELRLEVVKSADLLCQEYMKREAESGKYPVYKATGMAYIRFAKEEKELFKLLYMRDRTGERSYSADNTSEIEAMVKQNTGLEGERAKLFHFEIWAFVHGIATMFATDFLDIDWELVSSMITDAYTGLKNRYGVE